MIKVRMRSAVRKPFFWGSIKIKGGNATTLLGDEAIFVAMNEVFDPRSEKTTGCP
jgi:hypothetical protein